MFFLTYVCYRKLGIQSQETRRFEGQRSHSAFARKRLIRIRPRQRLFALRSSLWFVPANSQHNQKLGVKWSSIYFPCQEGRQSGHRPLLPVFSFIFRAHIQRRALEVRSNFHEEVSRLRGHYRKVFAELVWKGGPFGQEKFALWQEGWETVPRHGWTLRGVVKVSILLNLSINQAHTWSEGCNSIPLWKYKVCNSKLFRRVAGRSLHFLSSRRLAIFRLSLCEDTFFLLKRIWKLINFCVFRNQGSSSDSDDSSSDNDKK